jgi:Cwf15/Cwc15 cell cycle control protein
MYNPYYSQPGQTSAVDVKKRDLRAELLLAEEEARNKKRKAEGKPPLPVENGSVDEEANKRRKLLQDALELDKDDDDEEEDDDGKKGDEAGDEESEEDSDDDEDDTAELLRELEKIKRERADEKERQEMEQSATQAAAREVEVATANPLLNLAAQLGQNLPGGVNTTVPGTFAVKRRWDDGTSLYYSCLLNCTHLCDVRFDLQESSYGDTRQATRAIRQRSSADRIPQVRFNFLVSDTSKFPEHPGRKFMQKFIKVKKLSTALRALANIPSLSPKQ